MQERKVLRGVNWFVAQRIRQIRKNKKLPASEVARRAGIRPSSYACLEGGYYRLNLDNLWRVLQILEVEVTAVWPKGEKRTEGIDQAYVDRVMAKQWELWQETEATLHDVVEATCEAFRMTTDDLRNSKRRRYSAMARGAAALLVKSTESITIAELCRLVEQEPSSLSHMIKRYQEVVENDPTSEFATTLELAKQKLWLKVERRRVSLL